METNNKLREAAEFVAHIDDNGYTSHDVQCAIDKARAALATPTRNCDRFATLPDALAAWRDIDPREAGPFDLWLFDTAKEGGSK